MSTNSRDLVHRSIGCIGFSAIAHSSLFVALLLAPRGGDLDPASKSGGGGKNDSPVEVVSSQPVESSTSAASKVSEPEVPVTSEAPAEVIALQKEVSVARVAALKAVPVKKSARPAAKVMKTITKSDVVTELPNAQPELEELSPEIAEDPSAEKEKSETGAPQEPENPSAIADSARSEADIVKEKPVPTMANAETAAQSEEAAKTPGLTHSNPSMEPKPATIVASNEAGEGPGKGKGEGYGNGQGSLSGSGQGYQTQAVEASARNPLPGNPLPQYPREDRLQNRQGTAIVLGDVRADGMIENVRLDKSSGSREMDLASLNAFKKWKFAPGPEAVVRKSFQFRLQGDAQVGYATLKR